MNFLVIFGIAFGLSLDAFAVTLTNSTLIRELKIAHGFRMAIFFGLFQMVMPIIGWAAGMTFSTYIRGFDHWIAFGLLAFVGGRMIVSGLPKKNKEEDEDCEGGKNDCRHLPTLFLLSVATSIDALAIGLSFAMIKIAILLPSAIIGVVTFFVCLTGYFLGKKIGDRFNLELDLVGGVILVGIGLKILLEHLLQ